MIPDDEKILACLALKDDPTTPRPQNEHKDTPNLCSLPRPLCAKAAAAAVGGGGVQNRVAMPTPRRDYPSHAERCYLDTQKEFIDAIKSCDELLENG